MHAIAKDVQSKAGFLSIRYKLTENVIDNLLAKTDLSYIDAYNKLIDIAAGRESG